jgi:hypothetical protein
MAVAWQQERRGDARIGATCNGRARLGTEKTPLRLPLQRLLHGVNTPHYGRSEKKMLPPTSKIKIEAAWSFEESANLHRASRSQIYNGSLFHSHRPENLKSHTENRGYATVNIYIVAYFIRALLSNGSVNESQQRDCFYVVHAAIVAMQRRGKHISAEVS